MKKSANFAYFLIYLLYWLSYSVLVPYLGIFYEQKGLTGVQIGYITALSAAMLTAAGLMVGRAAAKSNAPKRLMAGLIVLSTVSILALYLCNSHGWLMLLSAAYGYFSAPVNAIADKLLVDRLSGQEYLFGRFRIGGSVGYGLGALLAALLLRRFEMSALFLVFGVVSVFLCCVSAGAPVSPAEQCPPVASEKKRFSLLDVIRQGRLAFVCAILVIWGIVESGYSQFMALHVVRSGFRPGLTSLLIACTMCGEVAMFFLSTAVLRRITDEAALALAFLFQFFRSASLALIGVLPLPIVLICQCVGGFAFALLYTASTRLIDADYAGAKGFFAQNMKNVAMNGVGAVIGLLLFGFLYERNGSIIGYAVSSALSLLCMGFLWICAPAKRRRHSA